MCLTLCSPLSVRHVYLILVHLDRQLCPEEPTCPRSNHLPHGQGSRSPRPDLPTLPVLMDLSCAITNRRVHFYKSIFLFSAFAGMLKKTSLTPSSGKNLSIFISFVI